MKTVECPVDVASNFTNQEPETVKRLLKTPSKFNSQKIGELRTESSLVHPKPKEFYGCSSSLRSKQLESGYLTNSTIKTSQELRSSKEARTASVTRKRQSQSSEQDLNTLLVGINGAIIGRSSSAKSRYSAPVKSFLMEQGWMSRNAKEYPAFAKPVRLLKLYSGMQKKPRKYSISGKCKSKSRQKASISPNRVETPQQFTLEDDKHYEL